MFLLISIAGVLLTCILIDYVKYMWQKRLYPATPYSIPFLGNVFALVKEPVKFWEDLLMLNTNGVGATQLLGKLMLFVTNRDLCQKIMTDGEHFQLLAHPNARFLFGANNLIYMPREEHKEFKRLFLGGLFHQDALRGYQQMQAALLSQCLEKISAEAEKHPEGLDLIPTLRATNARISQQAMFGPYLSEVLSEKLAEDILVFTNGFLEFPFPYPFPGTGLGNSYQAKLRLEDNLKEVVRSCYDRIVLEKEKPVCVLDYWMEQLQEKAGNETQTDLLATTLVDFLFAAQDATTSALMWCIDVLVDHPETSVKIRKELDSIKYDSFENLYEQLDYTKKVALEILRYRPPVPMVPHLVIKDSTLKFKKDAKSDAESVFFPKGSMVVPSIAFTARNEPNATEFNPELNNDSEFLKVLVFGAGAHKCPGRKYAAQALTVFLVFASKYELIPMHQPSAATEEKKTTAISSEQRPSETKPYMYLPTLFPTQSNYKLRAC